MVYNEEECRKIKKMEYKHLSFFQYKNMNFFNKFFSNLKCI